MNRPEFTDKVINYLFLGISEVANQVPMGGKHWVESSTEKLVERLFKEYRHDFQPASQRPVDLCRAWINLMHKNGFVTELHYHLEEEGEAVRVEIDCQECNYTEYCTKARQEGLLFVCHRMVAFKWITSHITGQNYQLTMEDKPGSDWPIGLISPAQPIDNILAREGDRITIAGERAVVLSTNTYGYLLRAIHQYAPQAFKQLLYEASYNSSLVEYDQVDPHYPDKRELIEWLLYYVQHLGVIRYEIVEYDEQKKRARVRGYGSYMVEMFRDHNLSLTAQVACHSARGRLAAYFSRAWNEEMVCEEMECEAMGHGFCEFVILPRNL